MLEILVLIGLTNRIGKIVEAKGYKSGKYKWMTVGLWFGGEIVGAIIGALIMGGDQSGSCALYVIALLGAAAGAGIANSIASNLPVISPSLVPSTSSGVPIAPEDDTQKLKKLKEIFEAGLITAQEYEAQKAEILARLVNGSTPTTTDPSDKGDGLEAFIAKINHMDLNESAELYQKRGDEFLKNNDFDDAILEFVKVIRISSPQDESYQAAQSALQKMGFSDADIWQIRLQPDAGSSVVPATE
jgi:tetratricopeptide (TPR) repeat protein